MNKFAPVITLFIALLCGAFAIYEYQQAEHYRALVAQMDKDAAGARELVDEGAAELRKLKETTRSQKIAIEQLETRNKELSSNPTPETPKAVGQGGAEGSGEQGGFMKGLAKMFTDPKMKDTMRAQQSMAMNMAYGDLARELGLAPDEARQVLALLADRQMELASRGMKAMEKGGTDPATLAAVGKETEAAKKAYDEQIKAILGDDRYKKFQDYEKTIGERFAMDQFQRQLSAGGTPLEGTQSKSLLDIMKQERARTPASPFDPGKTDVAAQTKALQSDEALNSWMQTQQDFNRRVLERARTVLSPDQILALEAAQKQQIDMQQMGVKMSREMMKK
jgi:hypothetical protein